MFELPSLLDVDSVRKQAVFCHRVLRQIQAIAKESTILSRESWETLLKFLLAANDSLLSPPLEKGRMIVFSNFEGN